MRSSFLLGELAAHPGRTLINVLVIGIGVAMGYAVQLINQSALNEFSQAMHSLQGSADLEIRGPRSGFDESLYPRIAGMVEVAAASPVVEVAASIARTAGKPAQSGSNTKSNTGPPPEGPLRILGIDVFRAASVQPGLVGRPAASDLAAAKTPENSPGPPPLLDPDAIFLSPAALVWLDVTPGQQIEVQVGLRTIPLRIAGTLPLAGAGVRIGSMDIGAAQWRLARLGVLSHIDLKLAQGVDVEQFKARLGAWLPAGVIVETARNTEQRAASLSRAYRVNLNVLALVALFTGGFLVFSSQTLAVVRRRAELALLRVLGVTRGGIVRLLVAESVAIGALGSGLGVAGGYVFAYLVLRNFGSDLGGGYFAGVAPAVHITALPALIFFLLGIAAAVLGSLVPAVEAAHARPAQALKAGDEEAALGKVIAFQPGLICIAAGALFCFAGPVGGLPLPGYLAIALLLIGGISLVPFIAHAVLSLVPLPRQPIAALALAQLAGAPGRAALALSGIVASFSLMVAMAIMVTSFRESVDQWLGQILPADLYVRAAASGDSGFFSPADVQRVEAVAGVARAESLRVNQIILKESRPPVALLSRTIDAAKPAARLPIIGATLVPLAAGTTPIWVSEAMVDLYGYSLGKTVTLPLAGRAITCTVAGIWRDYVRQHGAVVMRAVDYRRITGDNSVTDIALWLTPGTTVTQVIERLRAQLPGFGQLEFAQPGEIRAASLRIFDRSFAVTYLLEAVAIAIGLAGVAAGFGAQALARAREFGVLRHLGVTRAQVGLMLALEGGLLGLLGVGVGVGLGAAVSLILIHVVNPQSFHWSMDTHVPWQLISIVGGSLLFAASVTAVASGRQAMRRSAIAAVREDW